MIDISASSSMLRRARDSGLFQDTLSKPFDLDTCRDIVDNVRSDEVRRAA